MNVIHKSKPNVNVSRDTKIPSPLSMNIFINENGNIMFKIGKRRMDYLCELHGRYLDKKREELMNLSKFQK